LCDSELWLAILEGINSFHPSSTPLPLVCVFRREFEETVKRLSGVSDANVAAMLGVIRQGEPPAIVMEYLSHGDLRQFLRQRVFDDGGSLGRTQPHRRNGPPSLR